MLPIGLFIPINNSETKFQIHLNHQMSITKIMNLFIMLEDMELSMIFIRQVKYIR